MRARAGRAASGRRGSCLSSRKIDTPRSLTINLWAVFKRFKYLNGRVTGPVTGCTNVRATRPGTTKREAIIQREAPCIMYTYTLACCVRGFSLYWFLKRKPGRPHRSRPDVLCWARRRNQTPRAKPVAPPFLCGCDPGTGRLLSTRGGATKKFTRYTRDQGPRTGGGGGRRARHGPGGAPFESVLERLCCYVLITRACYRPCIPACITTGRALQAAHRKSPKYPRYEVDTHVL